MDGGTVPTATPGTAASRVMPRADLIASGSVSRLPLARVPDYVDITPHVSLLAKVGQSGHSVADALAELVDNAIDARVNGSPVRVDVDLDLKASTFIVRDTGSGMTGSELGRALVLAESSKSGQNIGRFGLGLKTACTSLGRRFIITSATRDGHYGHTAEYDADAFLREGRWQLPIHRKRKRWEHGTVIEVHSDRLYPGLPASLTRNLGWSFRHFLIDGILDLSINGEPVDAGEYDVDPASVMPIEGEVAGRPVRGWAGLLHQSSQRGWYGFALVRHRRIVRRHEKVGFQPHPQTARVVGELHLDEFDTNNLKTDFIRETEVWRELESWVSHTIDPVVAASRRLAHAGMLDLRIRSRIASERERLADSDTTESLNLPDGLLSRREGLSAPVAVAVGALHLEHVYVVGEPDEPYVDVEDAARPGEADLVVVRTNLGHAAAGQISDKSGWACHNVAEAAAARMSRGPDQLQLKSVILSKLLAERGLRRALTQSARDLNRALADVGAG